MYEFSRFLFEIFKSCNFGAKIQKRIFGLKLVFCRSVQDTDEFKAYLNIADFSSAQEFTNYLKILDENITLYYEYFQWKEEFEIKQIHEFLPLCELCQKLHQDLPRKEYPDFSDWIKDQMICIGKSAVCLYNSALCLLILAVCLLIISCLLTFPTYRLFNFTLVSTRR